MGILKCSNLLFILFAFPFFSYSQDTTVLSRAECESMFLEKNLSLIAEKLEISKAEAMVTQAKLWPNPTLEVDEVNLWASKKQLAVFGDELQGFNGKEFGKNQQLAFSIEQVIITAGKRKKLVAVEKVSVEKSLEYFEDLLRNLKIEFRNLLTELQYLQFGGAVYENQITSLQQLTQSYQRQVEQNNVAKGEYIRLKALELEMSKDFNDLNKDKNEVLKELKLLMRLPSSTNLEITPEGFLKNTEAFENFDLNSLLEQAKEFRPDFKLANLEKTYYDKMYTYEKSQRMPDLAIKGGYDRGGNFMYDFVGFGLTMDLPFFDRNQGNIKSALIGIEQSQIHLEHKELSLENETVLAYQNLRNAIDFLGQIEDGYEDTLDQLLTSYTKNFTERNISLLEYLDFLEAYMENKIIILEAGKEVNEKTEELNYAIGTDVIN